MTDQTELPPHTLGIFASASVPGDPEWARIMTLAGTLFARNKTAIVCLAENGAHCRPLVAACRAAGGEVRVLSDGSVNASALSDGVRIEIIADADARLQRMSDLSDALVGFPASLAAVASLFNVWVLAGGGSSGKPVALLNRNRAYEVVRGYAMDVLSHSLSNAERLMFFADTVEELWNKLQKALAGQVAPH